jgi:hypothetical protein
LVAGAIGCDVYFSIICPSSYFHGQNILFLCLDWTPILFLRQLKGDPMGLTLHYTLAADAPSAANARTLVEELRQHAGSLAFQSVSEIIEFEGDACALNPGKGEDPHAWLKVETIRFETEEDEGVVRSTRECNPLHILVFTVRPGEGCEPANFGLCRYPESSGWSWSSFCKTQYASNPAAGGVANFLKCHLGLISLLDKAKAMGILRQVHDEGQFWDNRDVEALIEEVGRWNRMTAGFYGGLRDAVEAAGGDPQSIVGEIAKFGNFEKLEMEGRAEGRL